MVTVLRGASGLGRLSVRDSKAAFESYGRAVARNSLLLSLAVFSLLSSVTRAIDARSLPIRIAVT
jgi:hypothetical protein